MKDFIVQQGLDASANALARTLPTIGIRVSRETILRFIKARGAVTVQQNLERQEVRVLSVDDINLRKGQPSTACSVFIDAETHRPLVIVQGATQAVAEKVMRHYPAVEMVSRDRGSAYSAAANALGKPQVADGFHLVQNLHQTVKESLQQILGSDSVVRTGAGWIRGVNEATESLSVEAGADQGEDLLVVRGPATLTETDREQRIRLAGLTPHQATKYRQTLSVLELTESGLRGVEIAKRLACTPAQVRQYRKQAPKTIQSVEQKIDQYYPLYSEGRRPLPSAAKARPSSASIVEPYRDTVVRLLEAGAKHRAIHEQIAQEGFTGSRNAVYQYVTKYAQEHDVVYQRHLSSNAGKDDEIPPRPEPIAVERTSTTTIYRYLLHLAASQRDANPATPTGLESAEAHGPQDPEPSAPEPESEAESQPEAEPWENHTQYADAIAKIVYDTEPKTAKGTKRKLTKTAWDHLLQVAPEVLDLLTCLIAFYEVLVSGEVAKLDAFIATYLHDRREPLATFAAGLQQDYAAVTNCLRYPDISNGPMEATNQKIKMVRRRTYGRAGLELLNGLLVLPWDNSARDPRRPGPSTATIAA